MKFIALTFTSRITGCRGINKFINFHIPNQEITFVVIGPQKAHFCQQPSMRQGRRWIASERRLVGIWCASSSELIEIENSDRIALLYRES